MSLHKSLTLDDIHPLNARLYADIAARNADTDFNENTDNINKEVRVDSPVGFFKLVSVSPAVWVAGSADGFTELTDTPPDYIDQAGFVLQVNVTEDGIEFGQDLKPTGNPTFKSLKIGNANNANPSSQADDLVIETDGDTGMTLFSPDGSVTTLIFGSPSGTGNEGARIRWNPTQDLLTIATTQATSDILFAAGLLNPTLFIKRTGQIGIGTVLPDDSAVLDLSSTTQGILPPRMTTTQRDAITSPASGLTIYNTTNDIIEFFNGVSWGPGMGGGDVSGPASSTDNAIARFNGADGKNLQNSGVIIDDDDILTAAQLNEVDALNVVSVYEAGDLPNILVNGTNYLIKAPITISVGGEKTFPANSQIAISTTNILTNKINYTGPGAFLQSASAGSIILNVQINSTGSGTLFDLTGNGANSLLTHNSGGYEGWDDLGTVTNFGLVSHNFCIVTDFDAGLKFVNCDSYFSIQSSWRDAISLGAVFFTFDANIKQINITSVEYVPLETERIFDIDPSAVVNAFMAKIQGVAAEVRYFRAGSLTQKSPGVRAQNCVNLPDSTTAAELSLTGNSASTIIPAAGAMVEINTNVNWIEDDVERMTVSLDGATTFNGFRFERIGYSGNINMEPATATKSLSIRTILMGTETTGVTFVNVLNEVVDMATERVNGDTISWKGTGGTLPTEIRADIVYFVVNQLVNAFQVSYTLGGAPVTFSDNGSGTTSYKVATLQGAIPTNTITAGSPRDLIPQATIPMITNTEAFIVVINNDDAVDILVNDGYQRYSS